jgi:hypothetical protein
LAYFAITAVHQGSINNRLQWLEYQTKNSLQTFCIDLALPLIGSGGLLSKFRWHGQQCYE